jgi:hypothetical protein
VNRGLGDDFDDFEEGAEADADDDFGDFDEGFEEPAIVQDAGSTAQPDSPAQVNSFVSSVDLMMKSRRISSRYPSH